MIIKGNAGKNNTFTEINIAHVENVNPNVEKVESNIFINKHPKDFLFENALDLIIELVEDDPSTLCEVIDAHYPNWCENNCENFNRDCLMKYLKHYKKGE